MSRSSKHCLPPAPRSEVAPFVAGEDAQDRHWRRLAVAAAMETEARAGLPLGLRLVISEDKQHWRVHDRDGRLAEWWPQSGRFVVAGNYKRPQKFHDVPGFLSGVRRRVGQAQK